MRVSLVALVLFSCGEPQPWPMGHWSGTSTLVHLPTMTATTSPIEVVSYYPGYNAGIGVDDPRFVFNATVSGRTIAVRGQPGPNAVSTFETQLDGGVFVATGALMGSGGTLSFDVSWSARDAGAGEAAVYTERATLQRVKDYDLSAPPGSPR